MKPLLQHPLKYTAISLYCLIRMKKVLNAIGFIYRHQILVCTYLLMLMKIQSIYAMYLSPIGLSAEIVPRPRNGGKVNFVVYEFSSVTHTYAQRGFLLPSCTL